MRYDLRTMLLPWLQHGRMERPMTWTPKPKPRTAAPPVAVEVTERGFHRYGNPITCTYGSTIKVYESSSAEGPHCWLRVQVDPRVLTRQEYGEGTAHLNEEQARALIARLQFWLDEIPTRWEGHE